MTLHKIEKALTNKDLIYFKCKKEEVWKLENICKRLQVKLEVDIVAGMAFCHIYKTKQQEPVPVIITQIERHTQSILEHLFNKTPIERNGKMCYEAKTKNIALHLGLSQSYISRIVIDMAKRGLFKHRHGTIYFEKQ